MKPARVPAANRCVRRPRARKHNHHHNHNHHNNGRRMSPNRASSKTELLLGKEKKINIKLKKKPTWNMGHARSGSRAALRDRRDDTGGRAKPALGRAVPTQRVSRSRSGRATRRRLYNTGRAARSSHAATLVAAGKARSASATAAAARHRPPPPPPPRSRPRCNTALAAACRSSWRTRRRYRFGRGRTRRRRRRDSPPPRPPRAAC